MPTAALSDAIERRPVAALIVYAAFVAVLVCALAALVVAWTNSGVAGGLGAPGGSTGRSLLGSAATAVTRVVGGGGGGGMSSATAAAAAVGGSGDLSGSTMWFSGGGRAAAAAVAAAAANASGGGGGGGGGFGGGGDVMGGVGGGGGVPPAVFLTVVPLVLLLGLAPAVAFAVGFKRRTDAFWRRCVCRRVRVGVGLGLVGL